MRHTLPFIGEEGVGLSPSEGRRGLGHTERSVETVSLQRILLHVPTIVPPLYV